MSARSDKTGSAGPPRNLTQPYATESEGYRFDNVKPPTESDQREAGKDTDHPERSVGAARRDGKSNHKDGKR
ncbi:hypothetical protein [Labrys monachus]|uniref:Uncharacterized protein n=1 Tax=Labrys monachus TaxID=217067 RepID=A0ABU0FAW5_9HYPH|nr:hypothetical protein [Labrys monachus]MDQ0391472.1 hypothetical protein [Labrys monachus]